MGPTVVGAWDARPISNHDVWHHFEKGKRRYNVCCTVHAVGTGDALLLQHAALVVQHLLACTARRGRLRRAERAAVRRGFVP